MTHTGIDLLTHLLLALYPAAAFFAIEILIRVIRSEAWQKFVIQGIVSIIFAIAYVTLIDATGIAIILFLLALALFLQAKRVKTQA